MLYGILRLSSCLQRQCIHTTIIPKCQSSASIKASQSGCFFHANLGIYDNVWHCGTGSLQSRCSLRTPRDVHFGLVDPYGSLSFADIV